MHIPVRTIELVNEKQELLHGQCICILRDFDCSNEIGTRDSIAIQIIFIFLFPSICLHVAKL